MAEVVADSLRSQILDGELEVVPQLEVLVREYDVGPPAPREALRILETEGLITVRRGKVGGADVHMPTNERVAYMLSLVLQSDGTSLADIGAALRHLEPMCASLGAAREDRREVLVPRLRTLNEEQAGSMGDRATTLRITDEFHALLVQECGNKSLVELVGALQLVWASHAEDLLYQKEVEPAPDAIWKAALREHERIADAVDAGDQVAAAELVLRHMQGSHAYMSTLDAEKPVLASTVHRRL